MVKKLWRYVELFSSDTGTLQTDRQTDLLYQYRASVGWRAIKIAISTNIWSITAGRCDWLPFRRFIIAYRTWANNHVGAINNIDCISGPLFMTQTKINEAVLKTNCPKNILNPYLETPKGIATKRGETPTSYHHAKFYANSSDSFNPPPPRRPRYISVCPWTNKQTADIRQDAYSPSVWRV